MARILIVEDEEAIAEGIDMLLKGNGHDTAVAGDGAKGLELARRLKPDLVVLDVMLPNLGGFEVCHLIKSEPATAKIKVVMLTALGRMGDVEKALAQGVDDYLVKPFDPERLLKKINKVLAL
jgi:DNA-binding response OmpR family regulator